MEFVGMHLQRFFAKVFIVRSMQSPLLLMYTYDTFNSLFYSCILMKTIYNRLKIKKHWSLP